MEHLSEAGLRANREYWANLTWKCLFEADMLFKRAQDNNLGVKTEQFKANLASGLNTIPTVENELQHSEET